MKLLLSIICVSFCLQVGAFDKKNLNQFRFEAGNWFKFPGQTRTSRDGDTKVFSLSPFFQIGHDYKLSAENFLSANVGYVLQQTKEEVSRNQFLVQLNVERSILDSLRLSLGSSFMMTRYSSEGGEVTRNNGNSTDTFYLPDESQSAFNQTLDFGIHYYFKEFRLNFNSYIYAWNEEDERLSSFSLTIGYLKDFSELFK